MNYRRMMRIPSLRKVTAPLAGVVLVLAGCAAVQNAPPTAAGPCSIIANGTPPPKTSAAPASGSAATSPGPSAPPTSPGPSAPPTSPGPSAPPTSRNISTNPEVATGYRTDMTAVRTRHYAAVTANPLATQAACDVLNKGGTAADALVTAQAVLGLVEPQSSGIGGGGFLLYYDAAAGSVQAYDGREVAPKSATENYLRWISDADRTAPKPDARASGRSIGVPGILRLLQDVHAEHGKNAWRDLFTPAVAMADDGFEISPRLAAAIADAAPQLKVDPNASTYFLNSDGGPKASGTRVTNPAYSKTLGVIASDPQSLYAGDIASDIVASAADTSGGRTPSLMTLQDLSGYSAMKREPLCTRYRGKEICGMPPPSSGGIAVAATLGMLEHFPMGVYEPTDIDLNGGKPAVMGVHLISEAERLAYADRDKYVADTDFVPLPGGSPNTLLNSDYLAGRAALI
ncbi:MAG TPA: gamma-glutamyltransferase, partial [Mycobacterium sp.]|nr:gamma-glutamyltransferase [Mycobacterium sp.]